MAENVCVVRLFGVQPDDGLLASATLDANDLKGPEEPAKPGWGTYVGGYVLATQLAGQVNASQVARPSPNDPDTITTCPFVKIRVSGFVPQLDEIPGVPAPLGGPVFMDCDRSVVMPSPKVAVTVLAPEDWLVDPSPTDVLSGRLWSVWVYVKICRWDQSWPTGLPILTEFAQDPAAGPTPTITRPRAARRLFISSQTVAQSWGMVTGGVVVGNLDVPAVENRTFDPLPAFEELQPPFVALARRTIAWGVQP